MKKTLSEFVAEIQVKLKSADLNKIDNSTFNDFFNFFQKNIELLSKEDQNLFYQMIERDRKLKQLINE